jgi:L-alanine-DL-glutamate epimerase-like enolase superfamily enzyme
LFIGLGTIPFLADDLFNPPHRTSAAMDLDYPSPDPLFIDTIDVLSWHDQTFIRATTRDGHSGFAATGELEPRLRSILVHDIIPRFLRFDARELPGILRSIFEDDKLQPLMGPAVTHCIAWVEMALLDLIGKAVGKPVCRLLGGIVHKSVPICLVSHGVRQLPEAQVRIAGEQLKRTGAKAAQFNLTRREGRADIQRLTHLLELARAKWNDTIAIQVDLAGAFDCDAAIEFSYVLKSLGVETMFNPCSADDFEATRRVTETVGLRVGWGEYETTMPRWLWAIRHHQADIMQPHIGAAGGMIRTCEIVDAANAAGLPAAPRMGAGVLDPYSVLQMTARTRLLTPFILYDENQPASAWCQPAIVPTDGALILPAGAGMGVEVDPSLWRECSMVLT